MEHEGSKVKRNVNRLVFSMYEEPGPHLLWQSFNLRASGVDDEWRGVANLLSISGVMINKSGMGSET